MRKLPVLLALALLASACGGDEDESGSLDCAWFANEDNCWRETIRAAASCLPAADATGLFSEDLATCSYADGAVVRFASPLGELPVYDDDQGWDFSIQRGAATCVAVHEREGVLQVESSNGRVRVEETEMGMAVVCPDGKRYSGSAMALFECPFDNWPGRSFGSSMMHLDYALLGTGDGSGVLGDGGTQLFACEEELDQAW